LHQHLFLHRDLEDDENRKQQRRSEIILVRIFTTLSYQNSRAGGVPLSYFGPIGGARRAIGRRNETEITIAAPWRRTTRR